MLGHACITGGQAHRMQPSQRQCLSTHPARPAPRPLSETDISTSRSSAPIARRKPISRVRSVDTDQHDVHDAYATHQQTHGSHRAQQVWSSPRVVLHGVSQLLGVEHIEVVLVPVGELAQLAQQVRQAGLSRARGRYRPVIDTSKVVTRVEPVTRRCQVLRGISTISSWSLPKAPCPLEDSEHTTTTLAREMPYPHALPQHTAPPLVQLRSTVGPITHTAHRAQLFVGELAALCQRPVARLQPSIGAAHHAGRPVAAIGHQRSRWIAPRVPRRNASDLLVNDIGIRASLNAGARWHRPAPCAAPDGPASKLVPSPCNLRLHGQRGAIA